MTAKIENTKINQLFFLLFLFCVGCEKEKVQGPEMIKFEMTEDGMLKLYKKNDAEFLYHEAWVSGDGTAIIHWGNVGEKGEMKSVALDANKTDDENILYLLQEPAKQGFKTISYDKHDILIIEYLVVDFGSDSDLEKRQLLEERMNEALGWVGVGICDGGSSGGGTMEAACYVVDFEIAKKVITEDLKGTEFADYSRIYKENE